MYKLALITGASSGIGKATAEKFAEHGISLVLIARREERLKSLADQLSNKVKCHTIACDVTDLSKLESEIKKLPADFSKIDVLLNNAGLALGLDTAQKADWKDWQQMIETNCTASAFLTQLILPQMVERNFGHIVNIGSIAGSYAYPAGNVYGATKAFTEHFSRGLKADLVGTAVRVTNIEPGLVGGAEFSLVRFKGDQERAAKSYAGCEPLNPESIADCIYWAISRPEFVNITRIEVMPVCQAPAGLTISRS